MRQASRNSCSVTTLCSTILSSTAEHRTVKNHFGCFGYTCVQQYKESVDSYRPEI